MRRKKQITALLGLLSGWFVMATMAAQTQAALSPMVEQVSGYTTVQRAFLREDFEKVVGLAQSFILQNPAASDVPRVWLWLVLSLDKLQQSSEALRELNRLKDRLPANDPLWPEILYWEGDISRRATNVVRARIIFQRLLDRYPSSTWAVQARLGIGLIDLHQQAFELAITSFRQIALQQEGSPMGRDAKLFEGLCQLQLKRYAEAAGIFAPLLEQMKEPANKAQAAFYLGETLSAQEKFEEAIAAYRRAIAVEEAPRWARPATFGLGWAYYRLGRCEESVKVFEEFLRGPTTDYQIEAWFAQGSCLIRLGRDKEALELFERILSRDPKNLLAVESGVIIADTYRRQGRSAMSYELLHQLLESPMDARQRAQIQLRLGSMALEEGNVARARSLYQMARESRDPAAAAAAASGLGDVQLFLGDLTSAKQLYEEVLRHNLSPSLAYYAAYQLGRIAMQRGLFNEAVEAFRGLAAKAEAGIAEDAHLALALTYLNQNEPVLARATLEEVRRRFKDRPASARAAYYLALIELDSGDEKAAKRLCEEATAKASLTDEALEARLLLADILTRQQSATEAMRWLRKAYAASGLPKRHRAKLAKRLGDMARAEGRYAEAILWYDDAVLLLPTLRGESNYRIAACYEEAGDLDLAMAWYGQVKQEPWRVRGQMALAKLFERQDRVDEAAAIYERLSKESIPEAAVAAEQLAALRESQANEE